MTELLHDLHITKVRSQEQLAAVLAKRSSAPVALLFTNKQESSTLYKGLSLRFLGRIVFAEVHEEVKDVVRQYSVTAFPTLLLIPKSSDSTADPVVYEGKRVEGKSIFHGHVFRQHLAVPLTSVTLNCYVLSSQTSHIQYVHLFSSPGDAHSLQAA